MKNNTKTLFSGIQPTGDLSIGHYFGVIRHWLELQHQYQCIFSIVDLHALTTITNPIALRENCYDLMAWYLACGLDPKKNILFLQSQVPEHAQLCWILNCNTYMGELKRMTQFKDKSQQFAQNINASLFSYPVLMAADILLYQAELVPVGHDQKQHLELTRDIALRFNKQFSQIFTVPKPVIAEHCARIMSLQDPTKKMSKSDPNQNSTILLSDKPNDIVKKIKRAVTDSEAIVAYDDARPGISNLVELYGVITGLSNEKVESDYTGKGYGIFKSDLAELLVNTLQPIRLEYEKLRQDEAYLSSVMQAGAVTASRAAKQTLQRVHAAVGLLG
ncbi:MAG: tryptophan--tRNA ligase [Pseudomonadota bacterium]|nr:tryptophan--tRNA ligase [Pseudomonadota bacterium]